jgi:aromatic ring hydroxylase
MLGPKEKYFGNLFQLKPNVYIERKTLRRDDLRARPGLNHLPQNPYNLLQKQKLIRLAERCVGCCAQKDSKGDRFKKLSEQLNPDHYVHIVRKKDDGIIVSYFKMSIIQAAYCQVPCWHKQPL